MAPPDYLQGCWKPSVGVTCPPKARIRASEAHTAALVVCFELWQLQAQGWQQDPQALQQEGQPVPPTPTPSIVHSTQTSHARQSLEMLAPNGATPTGAEVMPSLPAWPDPSSQGLGIATGLRAMPVKESCPWCDSTETVGGHGGHPSA